MKVLIIGANGQLGREMSRQLHLLDDMQVVEMGHSQLDITVFEQVKQILEKHRPEVVVNCAAYTAVDACETEEETAYKVNALGPKHLAIVCDNINAKLVHISTDYVFAGDEAGSRKEDDQTIPRTVYGKSKLLGESFVKQYCSRAFIIRTAWLYGDGNNFVRTMLKLAKERDEVSVVDDQFGTPTSTKELARVIIELMKTQYYGIFHGTCEGSCSWYEFACYIFKLAGCKVKVNKVTSEQFVRPAPRPKYSVLDNFMLKCYDMNTFCTWQEAIEDYLR